MTNHQSNLLELWRKAMKRREHIVFNVERCYDILDAMEAVDRDIEIEIESLLPAAKYCQKHQVTFQSLGVFVDSEHGSANAAMDELCKKALENEHCTSK